MPDLVEIIRLYAPESELRSGTWKKDHGACKKVAQEFKNPITNILSDLDKVNWKTVYKGFKECNLPFNDKDSLKLTTLILNSLVNYSLNYFASISVHLGALSVEEKIGRNEKIKVIDTNGN